MSTNTSNIDDENEEAKEMKRTESTSSKPRVFEGRRESDSLGARLHRQGHDIQEFTQKRSSNHLAKLFGAGVEIHELPAAGLEELGHVALGDTMPAQGIAGEGFLMALPGMNHVEEVIKGSSPVCDAFEVHHGEDSTPEVLVLALVL
jgi:hypothetical protein